MITLIIVGFILYILGKLFFPGSAGLIGGIAMLWVVFVIVCLIILIYHIAISL